MSLITVIIVIGFVAILASILMMTSLINFRMKQINVHAKDSFYSAEQVLDEISLGLQRSISDGLSTSYTEIMTDYAKLSTEEKNDMLQTRYYEYMWNLLQKDATHKTYETDKLYDYLKTSTKWHGDNENGYGAILRAIAADGTESTVGDMITYEKNGIVLKNLVVYYKDVNGYISKIKTDIKLVYPDFDFAASTVLPDIPSYSFIADGGVQITRSAGGNIELEGNVYTDSLKAESTTNKVNLTHKGVSNFIVKHSLDLKNASYTNEGKNELWASDIVAESSNVTLLGNSNIADDLNIKGNGSEIKLGGIYNGFGNSLEDSTKSSAILVNGTDAVLDLSDIKKIQLSGHAYIGVKNKIKDETKRTGVKDVLTGESLSVKSNQLMYLVPPECIGVMKSTGKSVYKKNPLTNTEYQAIYNKAEITEIDPEIEVAGLGEKLGKYISVVGGVAKAQKVFVPTSGQTLVYYYMEFPDEDTANDYFAKYYNCNKETLDQYMSFYAKEITFPNTSSLLRLRIAGNAAKGNETEGYENLPALISDASDKFANASATDSGTFAALCTKMIKSPSELSNLTLPYSETNQVVFENVVNETALDEFIANFKTTPGTVTMSDTVEGKDAKAIVTSGNCNVNDKNIHLVIAKGDVSINVDQFSGTILTNGKVTVGTGVKKIEADEELVRTLLRFTQTKDDVVYPIASVMVGGTDFIYSSFAGGEEKDSVTLADLVIYENWTKE